MCDSHVKNHCNKIVMYEQSQSILPGPFSSNPIPHAIPPTPQLAKGVDVKDILKAKAKELKQEFEEEGPTLQGAIATVSEEAFRKSKLYSDLVDQLGGGGVFQDQESIPYKKPTRRRVETVPRKTPAKRGGSKKKAPKPKKTPKPKKAPKPKKRKQTTTLF